MLTLTKILKDKWIKIPKEEYNFKKLPDLKKSLNLLKNHIEKDHNIWILWDFDTDGITSTSSFILGLRELFPTINFFYKVPERSEWHWLNQKNIDYMNTNSVKLIFTCDNWSNDYKQIEYARSLWIEVIVTDHHQITIPSEKITYSLINCEREDSEYEEKHLCWCWIVYKLLQAIESEDFSKKISSTTWDEIRRLTMIATIVDMVKLNWENLYFITKFKSLFKQSESRFFNLLLELTDYLPENWDWFWWTVWPIFNWAWRLEKANWLINLIINSNIILNLEELLMYYIRLNDYRKEITKEWNLYLKGSIKETEYVNLIVHPEIPSWLRRLIANEYLDEKIAFCWWTDPKTPNIIDCSVSNAFWINVLDFLREKDYTTNVWWHYWAFWYSYLKSRENDFLTDLNKYISTIDINKNNITEDTYELSKDNLNLDFIKELNSFIWWMWLSEPKFLIKARVVGWMILAKKHLKLNLDIDWKTYEWIKWWVTNYSNYKGRVVNLSVKLRVNRYLWKEKIQFFFE